jgi:DNA-binding NtrC family response regulator
MTNGMAVRPRLLLVDDEPAVRRIVERFAQRHGFNTVSCADGREALDVIRGGGVALALVDVRLPHVGGLEVLKTLRQAVPDCKVVLMSGATDVDTAAQATQLGAIDYLAKPLDFTRLGALFAEVREAESVPRADDAPSGTPHFHGLIGSSVELASVCASIRRLAPFARTALVTGETGTGKELAARALHAAGARARGRFITINCSAVVESLFESELFGHVKGAFTGAIADKAGLFEQAHQGTLFLDEIGELSLAVQAKLLRVLEGGELLRVGALQPKTVDVHLVAATNRDLRAEVVAGRFRQDLLFRLNMIEIAMPPLRNHRDDVPILAHSFLERFATRMRKSIKGFTPEAEARLRRSDWPGNVRELRNVIERACIVAEGSLIGVADLPLPEPTLAARGTDLAAGWSHDGIAQPVRGTLTVIERNQLVAVLNESAGNKAKAAATLGLSRRTFYRRLEKHGLAAAIQRRADLAERTTQLLHAVA